MKNFENIRVLLNIDLPDRYYRYSNIDGEAYKYSTSSDGRVLREDEVILYKRVVKSVGNISSSVDVIRNSPSISNVKISLLNIDRLDLGNEKIAIESGDAEVFFILENDYEDIIANFKGKISGVSYDEETFSFSIVNEEITLFKNVPTIVLEEDTFQRKLILRDAEIESSPGLVMRFGAIGGIWGHTTNLVVEYVKRITHQALAGRNIDFWKGARIDVVDAEGLFADPTSEYFSIGEFAVAIASSGKELILPTVLDRYFLYNFIDEYLRDPGAGPTEPNAPYEMVDVINNTMKNTARASHIKLLNGTFDSDVDWTKGAGWVISAGVASRSDVAASSILSQDILAFAGTTYTVEFDMLGYASDYLNVRIGGVDNPVQNFDLDGRHKIDCVAGNVNTLLEFVGSTNFEGSIDNVVVTLKKPTFQIIKNGIPENADSVGRAFPIVYGHIEKMLAVWSISSKSTRQNSVSAGNDVYIIAAHKIMNKHASEVEVYFGLDENAKGMNVSPGKFDYVPDPLPKSIYEVDHWQESGYSLVSTDSDKNICPFHKLVEITTNKGEVVTAIKLRGDEYNGWLQNEYTSDPNAIDGLMPGVNGEPQFPIRYGLGNSKIYVSFDGIVDYDGSISGVTGGLIEHPVDIIKHFLINHTNINEDYSKIDEQSFANAKSRLENWKFSVAITDIINGRDFVDRITNQCKTVWQYVNNTFTLTTFDLEDRKPTVFLDSEKHFGDKPKWKRKLIKDIYNDFIFRYGYDYVTKSYKRVITRNHKNDQVCRDSYSRYGNVVRSLKEIKLPDINDAYTANEYADHIVSYYAKDRDELDVTLRFSDETRNLTPGIIASVSVKEHIHGASQYTTKIYMLTNVSVKNSKGFESKFIELS